MKEMRAIISEEVEGYKRDPILDSENKMEFCKLRDGVLEKDGVLTLEEKVYQESIKLPQKYVRQRMSSARADEENDKDNEKNKTRLDTSMLNINHPDDLVTN